MLRIKKSGSARLRKGSAALRAIRNVAISVVVLLALVVGGGVAYTWYIGKKGPIATPSSTPTTSQPAATIKPSVPSPEAKVGASVQYITPAVTPGYNASITVKTNAGAKCQIAVEYNKVPSKDSGLVQKVADEFGMVSWTWTVDASAPFGKWPVKVTCANNKNSAVVQGDLRVTKT